MSGPREHIRRRLALLGTRIDAISWSALLGRIEKWSQQDDPRYVCLCGPQSLARGHRNMAYLDAIAAADTAAPDGAIMAWVMRRRGVILQEHIDGARLLWRCAERASITGTPVYLLGGTPSVLQRVAERLRGEFPALRLVGHQAVEDETDDQAIAQEIVDSGAKLVLVGPGAADRAVWIARLSPRIKGVIVDTGDGFMRLAASHQTPRRMRAPASTHSLRQRILDAQHKGMSALLFVYYLVRDQLELHSPGLKTQ